MNEEIWKDIPWTNGLYQASNMGRIRSVGRWVQMYRGGYFRNGKIMAPSLDKLGYLRIRFKFPGTPLIHRMVLISFLGDPPKGMEVNHKDGDKTNNRLDNLEWVSKSDNVLHSYKVVGRRTPNFYKRPINAMNQDGSLYKSFESVKAAAEFFGTSKGTITTACKRGHNVRGFKAQFGGPDLQKKKTAA